MEWRGKSHWKRPDTEDKHDHTAAITHQSKYPTTGQRREAACGWHAWLISTPVCENFLNQEATSKKATRKDNKHAVRMKNLRAFPVCLPYFITLNSNSCMDFKFSSE